MTVRVVGSAYGAEREGRGRACESCARGWIGEQGKHRAGRCGRVWWRRSFARTSLSRSSMITNRMYGSMCGSRVRAQLLLSPFGLFDTRTGGGYWSEQARRSRWQVAELCARELPAHPLGTAQRLLPARLATRALQACSICCPAECIGTPRLGGNAESACL